MNFIKKSLCSIVTDFAYPYFGHWYHDNIFDNLGVIWTGPEIRVGNSKFEEVPAETKFWSYFGQAVAYYTTDFKNPATTNWSEPYVAVNRSGRPLPDYQDP
ncbi:hypothetical protein SAMN04488168_106173 [Bacillus sp. 491mf]|uniref:hypothetical protein n=1 Tax=Bacillus sp. 491mf TaxID=1761755 RepID=UPI0008F34D5C|nr:hypothetical protein [Bacillus sp. 491mf]SFC60193.1 hypothetical protein SAMN04488168_106173 [Bacillus sp. 491mf]